VKTDELLGIVTILPSVVGLVMAIHPPSNRLLKRILVAFFLLFGAGGIFLIHRQSNETEMARKDAEAARIETQTAIQKVEAATQQQLEQAQMQERRLKDENNDLRAISNAMDKRLQLIGKSAASPELEKKLEQIHRNFQRGMSEHQETTDSIKVSTNPPTNPTQK
jgi:hypothetical protein